MYIIAPQVNRIKLYADLSRAAFQKKLTLQLSLWHILRSLPSVYYGNIRNESIGDLCRQLSTYGYTEKTAYRQLKAGDNLFWRLCEIKGRSVVKIYGLYTVCRSLGITRFTLDRHARFINPEMFTSTLKRHSQLYASIFKSEGLQANPITREKIESITGLSRIQQRRYEKAAGIKRTPTYEDEIIDGETIPVTIQVYTKSGCRTVPRRLGNIYHTRQDSGCIGQLAKVKKTLGADKESFLTDGLLPLRKLFFTSLKRLNRYFKAFHNYHQGYYMVRSTKRYIKGRLEYCYHQEEELPLLRGVNHVF